MTWDQSYFERSDNGDHVAVATVQARTPAGQEGPVHLFRCRVCLTLTDLPRDHQEWHERPDVAGVILYPAAHRWALRPGLVQRPVTPPLVWVLSRHVAFAGAAIVGVFSTLDLARGRADTLALEERARVNGGDDWWQVRGLGLDVEGPPVQSWNGVPRPLVAGQPTGTEIVWKRVTDHG